MTTARALVVAAIALAGCGSSTLVSKSDASQPDASEPLPPVTFSLENAGVGSVYLYQGCLLELTITQLGSTPQVIGRGGGCASCNCDTTTTCPAISCGACYDEGREVAVGGMQTYEWSPVDTSYETRGAASCYRLRALPAGQYRIDVPVFSSAADAVAKIGARTVTRTFDLPATGPVIVPLALPSP